MNYQLPVEKSWDRELCNTGYCFYITFGLLDFYSCSVGSVAISPSSSNVGSSIKLSPPPPPVGGGAYLVKTFLSGGKLN